MLTVTQCLGENAKDMKRVLNAPCFVFAPPIEGRRCSILKRLWRKSCYGDLLGSRSADYAAWLILACTASSGGGGRIIEHRVLEHVSLDSGLR